MREEVGLLITRRKLEAVEADKQQPAAVDGSICCRTLAAGESNALGGVKQTSGDRLEQRRRLGEP